MRMPSISMPHMQSSDPTSRLDDVISATDRPLTCFGSDSTRSVQEGEKGLRTFCTQMQEEDGTEPASATCTCGAFIPVDSDIYPVDCMATGHSDGTIKVWDYRDGRQCAEFILTKHHQGDVIAIAGGCTQKNVMFSISRDGLKAWDFRQHSTVHVTTPSQEINYNSLVTAPVCENDESFELIFTSCAKQIISVWEFKSGLVNFVGQFDNTIPVQHLDVMSSKNGSHYIVCSVKSAEPPIIELWDIKCCREMCQRPVEEAKEYLNGDPQPESKTYQEETKEALPAMNSSLTVPAIMHRIRAFSNTALNVGTRSRPSVVDDPSHHEGLALLLPGRLAIVAPIKHFIKDGYTETEQVIIALDASDKTLINVWKTFLSKTVCKSNHVEKIHCIRTDMHPYDMAVLKTPKPLLIVKLKAVPQWEVWDVELGVLVRELSLPCKSDPLAPRRPLADVFRRASKRTVMFCCSHVRYYKQDPQQKHFPAHVVVTCNNFDDSLRVWDFGMGPKEILAEYEGTAEEWVIYPGLQHPRVVIQRTQNTAPRLHDLIQDQAAQDRHGFNNHAPLSTSLSTNGQLFAVMHMPRNSNPEAVIDIWRIQYSASFSFQVSIDSDPALFAVIDKGYLTSNNQLEEGIVLANENEVNFVRLPLHTHKGAPNNRLLYEHSASHLATYTCKHNEAQMQFVVSASKDEENIKVFNLGEGHLVRQIPFNVVDLQLLRMRDHHVLLAAGRDSTDAERRNTLTVWDLIEGEQMYQIRGVEDNISSIALLPHTFTVCSASGDRYLMLWDLSSGTCVKKLELNKPKMVVKKILNVSTHKPVLLVLLQDKNYARRTDFGSIVGKVREHAQSTTITQVIDMSNHLFGLGSLDSLLSTVDLDLQYDQTLFSHTLELVSKSPRCMPLLSFRIDAEAQRRSPLVYMLTHRMSGYNFFEHVFQYSPHTVACFIPLWKMERLGLRAISTSKKDKDWTKSSVSPVMLFLIAVGRILEETHHGRVCSGIIEADDDDSERKTEIERHVTRIMSILLKAWNILLQNKKQSWAYVSTLACYLDTHGLVRHASTNKNIRRFHVDFLRGIKVRSISQVLEYVQHEKPMQANDRTQLFEHELNRMSFLPTKYESEPQVLVPIAAKQIALVEAIQLFCDECTVGPQEIFNRDIPDSLICANWDRKAAFSVAKRYEYLTGYYCVWVSVFTFCNAWFYTFMTEARHHRPHHGELFAAWFSQGFVLLLLVPLVAVEVAMIMIHKKKATIMRYLRDTAWNLLGWLGYTLTVAGFLIRAIQRSETRASRIVLSIANVIVWGKLLWFLRGFKKAGPVVAFLYRTTYDIFWYLVVAFIIVIAFAESLFLLSEDTGQRPFRTSWNSIYTAFVFMLGNVDENMPYGTASTFVTTVLLTIFMLISAILVVNMIIAKMTDSFGAVQSNVVSFWRMEQAKIILDMLFILDGVQMMFAHKPSELDPMRDNLQDSNRDPFQTEFVTVSEDSWEERNRQIVSSTQVEDVATQEKLMKIESKLEALEKKLDVLISGLSSKG